MRRRYRCPPAMVDRLVKAHVGTRGRTPDEIVLTDDEPARMPWLKRRPIDNLHADLNDLEKILTDKGDTNE